MSSQGRNRPQLGQLDLFRNMTDLFNDLDMVITAPDLGLSTGTGRRASFTGMKADVTETDDNILVLADLPGCRKEDIAVDFNDESHMLTVCAQRKEEKAEDRGTVHFSERRTGPVKRSFILPENTSAEKVKADYQSDGVLKLTFNKKSPEARATKRIAIS